jgi:tetratricopeptide (TPR) repeat protein
MRLYQALGDRNGEASTLSRIGYSYHLQEQAQKALEYYNKALAIWQALGNKRQEATEQASVAGEYADTW